MNNRVFFQYLLYFKWVDSPLTPFKIKKMKYYDDLYIWPSMSKKARSSVMNRPNFYTSQITSHLGDWINNYINTRKRACNYTNWVGCLETLQTPPGTVFTGKFYEETTKTIRWWNDDDALEYFKIYGQLYSSVTAIPDIPRSNRRIPNTLTISRRLSLWHLLRLLLLSNLELWEQQQEMHGGMEMEVSQMQR